MLVTLWIAADRGYKMYHQRFVKVKFAMYRAVANGKMCFFSRKHKIFKKTVNINRLIWKRLQIHR